MKCWMRAESVVAALLLCAGAAAAAPRGWSTDYQGALSAGRASGKLVLIAIVDTENCYASRAFKRNVVNSEGWEDWREGNMENLLLVWWDRAEMADGKWSNTAFLFAPGGETPSLSTPLVAMLSPGGMRVGPVIADSETLLDFGNFTETVDERLEEWDEVPTGALVWPTVTSASGLRARWSLDYQGSRDKGFAKRWPVLVAIVDSGGTSATTEAWVRGVLMTPEWQEWLEERNILLVWWDRAKISRSKWDDVAFRFAAGGESITLPQMVLFDTNGLKTDQFLAVNNGAENLLRANDFISRLEDNEAIDWGELGFGPGKVGFTATGQTVSAATNVVTVTVERWGGASEGTQTFRVYTESGNEPNKAVTNVHYEAVDTTVDWAAGESGKKTVTVPLLGVAEDSDVTVTQRVFHVKLEKGASATAKLKTNDHTVTISYAPGMIGFTTEALAVYAGETNVEVTVRRSGGALGPQSATLKTYAGADVADYFEAVETNLVWTSGEEGEKRVLVPLKGDALDWRAALTGQVFYAVLSLATNLPAAEPGITNLAVALYSFVERTGDWAYDRTSQWKVAANTNGRASALAWNAPQGGWLDFAWCKGDGDGTLAVELPGLTSGLVTNSAAGEVTNRVAMAEGDMVVWTVTNCTAMVKLLEWTPAEVQMIAPTNGVLVAATNVTLSWAVQPGVTSRLYYVQMPIPEPQLNGVYGGVTNDVPYSDNVSDTVIWYVEMEIYGDSQTVAQVRGPEWLFRFQTQIDTPAPPLPTVDTMVSRGIVLHQNVPASVSVAVGLEAAHATRRYTAKGLPSGLKIDASTGVISGTPKRAGLSLATVKATGDGAAAVIELAIEVLAFPAFALGEFQGMVLDDAGRVRGALALKVSSSGAVSGKIESGGQSRSLRGVWVGGSAQSRAVRLSTGRAVVMELSFTPEGVEGVTSEGWRVFARPLLSQQAAQPFAGSYSVVLRADTADTPGTPSGYGYLTYTVTPRTRSVKYGGLLADGTSVSGSAKMVAGDEGGAVFFPLYKGLYTRRGEVSGVVVSMPDGGVGLGQGGWVNPGGGTSRQGSRVPFDVALDGVGARYAQPEDWRVLDGAVLTAGGQPFAVLSAARGKPVAQTAGVSFSLTKKSGVFTGRFKDEDNIARSFKGVYIPALLYGAGFYLCPDDGTGTGTCSLPIELE